MNRIPRYIKIDKHHQVRLEIGVQSFRINLPCEDEKHANWLKDMLTQALSNMVRELIGGYEVKQQPKAERNDE